QSHCRPSDGRTCAVGNRAPPAPARTQSPPARRRKRLLARRARAGRCELILRVLERSDLTDDFADLKVAASGLILTFASLLSRHFANVRITRPLANISF